MEVSIISALHRLNIINHLTAVAFCRKLFEIGITILIVSFVGFERKVT